MTTPPIDDTVTCPACNGSGAGSGDTSCGFCGGNGGVPLAAAQAFDNRVRAGQTRKDRQ